MCGSSSMTRRCRRVGDNAAPSRSEEAGDRGAVAAQVVEQRAHVGGRLHQHHQQRVGVEDRDQREAGAELRSEEHTSELQSQSNVVCRLLLEKNTEWTTSVLEHKGVRKKTRNVSLMFLAAVVS